MPGISKQRESGGPPRRGENGGSSPRQGLLAAAELFRRCRKLLIVTHMNPDGDAWGSACALARICLLSGKEARLFCPSERPEFLSWMDSPVPCAKNLADLAGWQPDLAVFLDCGRADRAGPEGPMLADGRMDVLNIDHHGDNPGFGLVNWVDPSAGATSELVGLLAESLGLSLSGELGEAVYLGLTADSGNFTYSNATPGLFAMATRIVGQGLAVEEFIAKSENNWSHGRMRLWGELLSQPRLFARGRVVSILVPRSLLDKHGCRSGDLEGLVSFLQHLREVEVALLIREKPDGRCKISLRSKGGARGVDVRRVAAGLGGGGHTSASGADMDLSLEETEKEVLERVIPALEQGERSR